jgi:hypothetical protein
LYRKALDDTDYKVHFDYFAVDFGEELSALYGGVLEQQADFAAACVEKILQLYTGKKQAGTSKSSGQAILGLNASLKLFCNTFTKILDLSFTGSGTDLVGYQISRISGQS